MILIGSQSPTHCHIGTYIHDLINGRHMSAVSAVTTYSLLDSSRPYSSVALNRGYFFGGGPQMFYHARRKCHP